MNFDRPKLTEEETRKVASLARILVYMPASKMLKFRMVKEIMTENARLLKEVNEHRQRLGYELLPIYEPNLGPHFETPDF